MPGSATRPMAAGPVYCADMSPRLGDLLALAGALGLLLLAAVIVVLRTAPAQAH
jgi:hypothetical protein